MFTEVRHLGMESGNWEEKEVRSVRGEEHWNVQTKLTQDGIYRENGTVERVIRFRNKMILQMLHTFVGFRPAGGRNAMGTAWRDQLYEWLHLMLCLVL